MCASPSFVVLLRLDYERNTPSSLSIWNWNLMAPNLVKSQEFVKLKFGPKKDKCEQRTQRAVRRVPMEALSEVPGHRQAGWKAGLMSRFPMEALSEVPGHRRALCSCRPPP